MINFKQNIVISLMVPAMLSFLMFILLTGTGFADSSSFEEIEKSDHRMYGERKIIVCGYPAAEQSRIQAVIRQAGLADIPTVFADERCLKKTLKEIIALPDQFGIAVDSRIQQRAVILSGLTNKEVHRIMDDYRANRLPSQLWATLIPTSENQTLKYLLDELEAEHNSFNQSQPPK